MKKGLLSLLAVALTVVSCQNYDDQFKSLTDQITTLSGEVAGLKAISDQVTALQQLVNGLASADNLAALAGVVDTVSDGVDANADAIADNATNATNNAAAAAAATASATAAATAAGTAATAAGDAVANVALQVASAQASIAQILLDLENVATDADLAAISSTLAQVQLDVKEILNKAETINQAINVINEGTLQVAESLIATGTDKPNVLLSNALTFNTTGFSASQQDRANEIAKKIQTVIGAVSITSTSTLDFENLTFANSHFTVSGGGADFTELRTVGGDFQSTEIGAVDYTWLGTVDGKITIIAGDGAATNVNSITSVDFSGLTPVGISVGATQVIGKIDAPKAAFIKTGNTSVATVTANAAIDIDLDYTGAIANSLTITGSGTIDILATSVSSSITINGAATSIVFANSLTGSPSFTMPTKVAQFHAQKIVSASGAINATVVDLSALDHNGGAALDISATDVDLTGFSTPGAGIVTFSGAGAITLTDMDAAKVAAPAITSLTILAKDGDIAFPATYAALNTLNFTGLAVASVNPSTQANSVTLSNLASLTTVSLGGSIEELISDGNAKLVSFTTEAGSSITSFTLSGATLLESVDLNHGSILYNEANVIDVRNNPKLAALDLSAIDKVKTLTVTGNAKLTSITAPSSTTLAALGADISVIVGVNSLTGQWTPHKDEVAATQTSSKVAAVNATLAQPSLSAIKAWTMLHTGHNGLAYSLDSFVASGTDNFVDYADLVANDLYTFSAGFKAIYADDNAGTYATGVETMDTVTRTLIIN
ncbi:hypothetical protein N9D55_01910 [Flavobacteriaceae bacterium]|nr:hypothetical protein [Flavobacteriaceae bacterium]